MSGCVLRCYVDERTYDILRRFSAGDGRTVEQLAEDAIAEAALRSEPSRVVSDLSERGDATT